MHWRTDSIRAQLAASALDDLQTEDCMYFLLAVGNLGFNMGQNVTHKVLVRANPTLRNHTIFHPTLPLPYSQPMQDQCLLTAALHKCASRVLTVAEGLSRKAGP